MNGFFPLISLTVLWPSQPPTGNWINYTHCPPRYLLSLGVILYEPGFWFVNKSQWIYLRCDIGVIIWFQGRNLYTWSDYKLLNSSPGLLDAWGFGDLAVLMHIIWNKPVFQYGSLTQTKVYNSANQYIDLWRLERWLLVLQLCLNHFTLSCYHITGHLLSGWRRNYVMQPWWFPKRVYVADIFSWQTHFPTDPL